MLRDRWRGSGIQYRNVPSGQRTISKRRRLPLRPGHDGFTGKARDRSCARPVNILALIVTGPETSAIVIDSDLGIWRGRLAAPTKGLTMKIAFCMGQRPTISFGQLLDRFLEQDFHMPPYVAPPPAFRLNQIPGGCQRQSVVEDLTKTIQSNAGDMPTTMKFQLLIN